MEFGQRQPLAGVMGHGPAVNLSGQVARLGRAAKLGVASCEIDGNFQVQGQPLQSALVVGDGFRRSPLGPSQVASEAFEMRRHFVSLQRRSEKGVGFVEGPDGA